MTDPRTRPDPALVRLDEPAAVAVPLTDLLRSPGGLRDRQLLMGAPVRILNRIKDHALVRSETDGYCGYVPTRSLGPAVQPTHQVTLRTAHAYSAADIKSPERCSLSFGARLTALSETATFIETAAGFVPRQQVHRADVLADDPSAVAALFLGTPYLWGGNSGFGIDCSGLVQAACLACGIPCPGDSDQQKRDLGTPLPAGAAVRRNDLLFWKGHVALVTDDTTLIHANAGHMAVAFEPIEEAIIRIETQGGGAVTAHKRLSVQPG
ncbi:NlpC/P60 family protein [uncultured Roseobacter sp.]|uniref:C40 family peptidase n=1 Tax=uncultured Roseobacter sp. TaxID=114847 RepID=UPI002609A77F|nr:NlpC/P60 family protein [uncultured Roseobacter sp.]